MGEGENNDDGSKEQQEEEPRSSQEEDFENKKFTRLITFLLKPTLALRRLSTLRSYDDGHPR